MEVKAPQNEKTIKATVYFFTDGIANDKDSIIPKHAWTKGYISLVANDSHGIRSAHSKHFNTLLELATSLEDLLIDAGITLHITQDMEKYISKE